MLAGVIFLCISTFISVKEIDEDLIEIERRRKMDFMAYIEF
jgi:hypothetical protein